MKKFAPLALLMFTLMVPSVWSIQWVIQAAQLKSALQNRLNPASLEVSGFPWRMVVAMTNPTVASNTPPQLHYALQGRASLSINARSDQLELEYDGSGNLQSDGLSLTTEHLAKSHCSMQLKSHLLTPFNRLWDMELFLTSTAWLKNLKTLECDLGGMILMDHPANGQILATFSPVQWRNLALQMQELEIFPAGETALAKLLRITSPKNMTIPSHIPAGKRAINLQIGGPLSDSSLQALMQQFILAIAPAAQPAAQ